MDSEQTEVILLCIQGILSDEPTLLVQPYGLISLETLPISTSGYGFVTWKHPLCLLSMSNMLLNMMLSPVFTKLIFTSNPWDWFYYPHFSNIKLRVREVSLFKIKKLVRGRAGIWTQVLWFHVQCPFLSFSLANSQSVILSLWLSVDAHLPLLSNPFKNFLEICLIWKSLSCFLMLWI